VERFSHVPIFTPICLKVALDVVRGLSLRNKKQSKFKTMVRRTMFKSNLEKVKPIRECVSPPAFACLYCPRHENKSWLHYSINTHSLSLSLSMRIYIFLSCLFPLPSFCYVSLSTPDSVLASSHGRCLQPQKESWTHHRRRRGVIRERRYVKYKRK
jgi:hypothetical protein